MTYRSFALLLGAMLAAGAMAQTAPRSVQHAVQPVARPAQTVPNESAVAPGTPAALTDPAAVVPNTGIVGAGAPGPSQFVPAGPSGYSVLQIAQSFRNADANLNGELTRAEAQRLSIMPGTFEEMDRNKDGLLTRSEYEDGLR